MASVTMPAPPVLVKRVGKKRFAKEANAFIDMLQANSERFDSHFYMSGRVAEFEARAADGSRLYFYHNIEEGWLVVERGGVAIRYENYHLNK